MKYNLIVVYDLMSPGQNYDLVQAKIQSLGFSYKFQYSAFYLQSDLDAAHAHYAISSVMDSNDRLMVIDAIGAFVSPAFPAGHLEMLNQTWNSRQIAA